MASDGKGIGVSASSDDGAAFNKARPGADQTPASPSAGESAAMTSEDRESTWGCDPMVKIELDAALVLTEFAQLALMARRVADSRPREGEEKWGGRGRRSRKQRPRSKEAWRSSFEDSERRASSGDAQDLLSNKQDLQRQKPWRPIVKKNIKIEQYVKVEEHVEFANHQNLCKKVTEQKPASRGKPKQYLNEAEKEERRLRRIHANRESARQTIRRRQAFCEELMKKAADLSLENKSIKQCT
ncbi:hypothetical protein EJ110_NYTH04985 [Nymphaea thermarum]|nr:hypothetical protein EJ110_NYTH04985 [Nymphaea thermarum]